MSDNTNYQRNQESTQADLSGAALSAWESSQVVKARVNMRIDAPTPQQTEQMTNEAARDARKCYVSNWKIQRNSDGTIANLKTDGDKVVHLRKDYLGDGTVGYSFRRQLGKANSGGDVILEDRMVMHNNVAVEDSMIWDTKNPKRPYTYLREVVASDNNIYTAEKIARAHSKENTQEYHFLEDKITKLNGILGNKGVAQMGYEIQQTQPVSPVPQEFTGVMPALGQMRQYQVDKQYMPGGTYPQLAGGSRYVAEQAPVADLRRNPVQGFNPGFTQGITTEQVPVADYHRNPVQGFNPGFTRGITSEQLQVHDYRRDPVQGFNPHFTRGRTTEHIGVRDLRRHPVQGINPGLTRGHSTEYIPVTPSDLGANRFPSGSTRALTPATVTDVTRSGDYIHAPLNGNTMSDGSDPFRKPKRPIINRPEPVREQPRQEPTYVPPPIHEAPKPATKPISVEGSDSTFVKTDVDAQLLPFKKKGQ